MAIPVWAELALGWRLSLVLNERVLATAPTFVGRREATNLVVALGGKDDVIAIMGNDADVAAVGFHRDGAGRLGGTGGRVGSYAEPLSCLSPP